MKGKNQKKNCKHTGRETFETISNALETWYVFSFSAALSSKTGLCSFLILRLGKKVDKKEKQLKKKLKNTLLIQIQRLEKQLLSIEIS